MYAILFFLIAITIDVSWGSYSESYASKNIKYQTFLGDCPSKSAGLMSLLVMKEFEKNRSLKDVKEKILHEKLDEKYFLSDYKIGYNPVINTLKIHLECPSPLAKVQVYKNSGEEHYSAILGDNAKLYEPQYEILMRAEKKLNHNLPLLAISMVQLEGTAPTEMAHVINTMDVELRKHISEIILNKNNELTIIFSLGGKATSVFMGGDFWDEKLIKLSKIVSYVSKNKRFPSTINLVNAKKVVVKFSDKI